MTSRQTVERLSIPSCVPVAGRGTVRHSADVRNSSMMAVAKMSVVMTESARLESVASMTSMTLVVKFVISLRLRALVPVTLLCSGQAPTVLLACCKLWSVEVSVFGLVCGLSTLVVPTWCVLGLWWW